MLVGMVLVMKFIKFTSGMTNFFRYCFVLTFLLVNLQDIYSQKNFNLSGCITDSASGEKIPGTIIFIKELSTGCFSNEQGMYSISLPKGIYTVEYRFIGYRPIIKNIALQVDSKMNIDLPESLIEINEVTVSDNSYQKQKRLIAGIQKIDMKSIENIPVLFGEGDVLKKVQMLPGIVPVVEGDNALYVRGSSSDQNLVLLDGANVFNPSHLYGIISIFNSDLIKDMTLYKGGMPVQYGGRVSSLLEINTFDGNFNKYASSGEIGLLSARLSIQGPIIKNKVSFIIGVRRSYTDLILKLFFPSIYNQYGFDYYDLNTKITILDKNNKINISGYMGNDDFKFPLEQNTSTIYGNKILSATWYHWFNNKLSFNFANYYSNYIYNYYYMVSGYNTNSSIRRSSTLEELSSKISFSYVPGYRSEFIWGITISGNKLGAPVEENLSDYFKFQNPDLFSKYSINSSIFANHLLKSGIFRFDYGLRYTVYNYIGPGKVIHYKDENNPASGVIDTVSFKNFQNIKQYRLFEPRVNLSILINPDNIIKLNYCKTSQFYQQIPSYTATNPSDIWVMADYHIKPQVGNQVSIGYNKIIANNAYELTTEAYYKWMENQVDLKTGGDLFGNSYYETELLSGTAYAYGAEAMLEKKGQVLNGWIAYSYLNAKRHIIGINNNQPYSPLYDITHNISIVLNYEINKRMTFSCDWNFHTGAAVTLPSGVFNLEDMKALYYNPDKRNTDRMPNYHRLDIAFTIKNKSYDTKKFKSKWVFAIYNAYNAKNPYFYTFTTPDGTMKGWSTVQLIQFQSKATYIFYIIPSVSYNFNF
jgi:hypothetical protein